MADQPDDLDIEYQELLAGIVAEDAAPQVPALLIRRARGLREPLLGRRARYLMTSHGPGGEWLAHGWKTDLRIVSEVVENVPGLEEPALWVQEERDFYSGYASVSRVSVGVSRIWVEQYVSAAPTRGAQEEQVWLDRLNANSNEPEIHLLHRAEGHCEPIGRRVVLVGDSIETDLRAASPVRMAANGDTVVAVVTERDWYEWTHRGPTHRSLRWEPAASVWVE